MLQKLLSRELLKTKKNVADFENSINYYVCDNIYVEGDVEVTHHCQVFGKYRGFAHEGCNIKANLSHKISVAFHILKKLDSHLFIQELSKFNFKKCHINWIRNIHAL